MLHLPRRGSAAERMIGRLLAQRAHLEQAARLIAGRRGAVLEIGLGKGRTLSHLRSLLPRRAIYALDRELHAPPADRPPRGRLIIGEIRRTLPALAARLDAPAVLAHCDIGTSRPARDAALARYLAATLPALVARGAIVVGDRPLRSPHLEPLPSPEVELPAGIPRWPYFLYRVGG